jgi:chromate transporter
MSAGTPVLACRGEDTVRLRGLAGYFLRLGATGFGGPVALAGYMQRDLVERRRWFTAAEYREGLALAQLAPGPLAAQLAMYLGWVKGGAAGAAAVGAAFVLPSFVMVVALSLAYLRFGGLSWMQGAFYGIGAAVIAIIARSAFKLAALTLGRDRLLWAIGAFAALVTAWTESEIVWVFLGGGAITLAARGTLRAPSAGPALMMWMPWLATGPAGSPAAAAVLWRIAWYFMEAGAFVFGSGLAIVPFLRAGVVQEFQWLDERQFLDAVAVAMITPGPVVITVAFIGYLVAGLAGACVAALATFLPCYLLTVVPAPHFRRLAGNAALKAFVDGVTAAATGAIAGAAFVLGRRALVDGPTVVIAMLTLAALVGLRKVPDPLLIAAAGLIGVSLMQEGRSAVERRQAPADVVFVCDHGSVKSLIAAEWFNRLAARRGSALHAVSRGLTPDEGVPPAVSAALRADGFDVASYRPRAFDAEEAVKARRVVSLGAAAPGPGGAVERWDGIPAATERYEESRSAIRARVEALLRDLEGPP